MNITDANHMKASIGWINTYSGRKFFPLDPKIEDFDIIDQAHALAQINRYTGHTKIPYPVASHSLMVAREVEFRAKKAHWPKDRIVDAKRKALIHDNPEAYIGDIVRPLKKLQLFDFVNHLEHRYEMLVYNWLSLTWDTEIAALIKEVDLEMCAYEAPVLFHKINPEWVFPDTRASKNRQRWIKNVILSYSAYSVRSIRDEYLYQFGELFPSVQPEEVQHREVLQ